MQAKRDKEMWEQTLCLKHFDFDEFRGPFKMGPKGQKCSFGDRNIIFGKQAQCDISKTKKKYF